ncbi:MAG TPA: hypothetical protein VI895_01990 [Bdellovibrionota bacterium]|nr:hypothetical protein [Bdellovibrionota bacterium]
MEDISVVGIDLAKNVFEVTGRNERGRTLFQRSLRREKFRAFISELPPTVWWWAKAFGCCGESFLVFWKTRRTV